MCLVPFWLRMHLELKIFLCVQLFSTHIVVRHVCSSDITRRNSCAVCHGGSSCGDRDVGGIRNVRRTSAREFVMFVFSTVTSTSSL